MTRPAIVLLLFGLTEALRFSHNSIEPPFPRCTFQGGLCIGETGTYLPGDEDNDGDDGDDDDNDSPIVPLTGTVRAVTRLLGAPLTLK
jgi:hypothetical protein